MADSRRKFNMATILNDETRTVGIWGCKNGLTVKKIFHVFYRVCFITILPDPRSVFKMVATRDNPIWGSLSFNKIKFSLQYRGFQF